MLIVFFSDCWCGKQNAQGIVEYALSATLAGDSALKEAVLETFAEIVAKVQLVVGG